MRIFVKMMVPKKKTPIIKKNVITQTPSNVKKTTAENTYQSQDLTGISKDYHKIFTCH